MEEKRSEIIRFGKDFWWWTFSRRDRIPCRHRIPPPLLPSFPPSSPRRRPGQRHQHHRRRERLHHLRRAWTPASCYLSDELVDVLAAQLGNDLLQLLLVGVDSDGGDDGLNVGSLGAGVAAEDGQKVSSHVTH